jgi:DNA invertase Pin-like site-specific DNA recombinase
VTSINMRSVLYCRVSTTDQNVEVQLTALREYAERRGWQVAGEYVDLGVSGSKEKRPALDKLMADARRRAMDAVVVFRFDRFARSVSHLARALDEFRALGIEFVSLHEAIDTSTAMGRAMFHIAGAFAELEREIIRERVKAGLANAKRRGRKVGRPRAIVNVGKVREMAANGLSARAIAKAIGVSDYTVRGILSSREKTPSADAPADRNDSARPAVESRRE